MRPAKPDVLRHPDPLALAASHLLEHLVLDSPSGLIELFGLQGPQGDGDIVSAGAGKPGNVSGGHEVLRREGSEDRVLHLDIVGLLRRGKGGCILLRS